MTGGRREGVAGLMDGFAEKLNFHLSSVGKGREVRERGGRWQARSYSDGRQRLRRKRKREKERERERREREREREKQKLGQSQRSCKRWGTGRAGREEKQPLPFTPPPGPASAFP
jgi:hypothetical protein